MTKLRLLLEIASKTGVQEMSSVEQQLAKVDLNLLNVFIVLMEERSVTGAAERLFVSQPAMSNKLQRLRDLFDDPLFIRTQHGLAPTPKAMELIVPLRVALSQISTTVYSAPFTPENATERINLQIPDSLSVALFPVLYSKLSISAPKLTLTSDNTTNHHLELLASGEADFSLWIDEDYGNDFVTFELGSTPSFCWMRKDHPLSKAKTISVQDMLAYPLVELSVSKPIPKIRTNTKALEQILEPYHLDNTNIVGSSQLLSLLAIVLNSDALFMGTPYLSTLDPINHALAYKQVNEFADIRVPLILIQHRMTESSKLHTWLREQIIDSWNTLEGTISL